MNRLPEDGADHRGDWQRFDETLADGPATAGTEPPAEARQWLMSQRFVHGLLRAAWTDAGTREERVQGIIDGLPPWRRRPSPWLILAAALVVAIIAWTWLPGLDALPQAEAAVARAAERLGEPVDRQFRLAVQSEGPGAFLRLRSEFTLTTRPGMRFHLEGDTPIGHFQVGCDGTTVWHKLPFQKQGTVALSEAERLLAAMGDVLDLGYLDVQALVQRLPGSFELRAVSRDGQVAGLGPQVRIEAVQLPEGLQQRIESAWLLFDEPTGMITRMELRAESGRGRTRTVVFEYLGEAEAGQAHYTAPR